MKQFLHLQPKWVSKLFIIFLVIIGCLLYSNIGRDPLFDWDEGIYAELGREMARSTDIFVPTWNHTPWFEKPPGIAWLSAAGQTIVGFDERGARFFQPLLATLTLYMVFLIGTHMSSWPVGVIAVAILTTLSLFLDRTRAVNTDMPLLLGITTTIALLMYQKKPIWVALALAFSVWFKGLAGLLPALIALPLLVTRDRGYIKNVCVYALVFILPWHAYAYVRYGETFLTPYIREQVITRVTSPIEFHLESRWFYFRYLYDNLNLGIIVVAAVGAYFALRAKHYIVIWWVLLPLIIFTLAKTRLFWYILPVYPALALLAAYAITSVARGKHGKTVVNFLAILALCHAALSVFRFVEPSRTTAILPDRLVIAQALSVYNDRELAVLVSPPERVAEAILPQTQRISSSFRYGGMPSVVYYYGGRVQFFYNTDEFLKYWQESVDPIAMITEADRNLLPVGYRIESESKDYLGIRKGLYALR